jgi:hypothetical protein
MKNKRKLKVRTNRIQAGIPLKSTFSVDYQTTGEYNGLHEGNYVSIPKHFCEVVA